MPQTCWRGKLSKAAAQLLLQAVAPELLAALSGQRWKRTMMESIWPRDAPALALTV